MPGWLSQAVTAERVPGERQAGAGAAAGRRLALVAAADGSGAFHGLAWAARGASGSAPASARVRRCQLRLLCLWPREEEEGEEEVAQREG